MLFLRQLLVGIRVFCFLARFGEHISAGNLRQSVIIHPKGKRVKLGVTINLSSEFDESENKSVPVTKWKLEVDNQVQAYGSPSYLNDGRLYLWLPATATGKNVTVTMSYLDNDGVEHDIEPMYVEEVGGSQGSTLKRYIDIDVDKLTDEQKEYFSGLQKAYDGLPFETLTVSDEKPIDTTPFETNGKLLTDPTKLEVSYQAYDGEGAAHCLGAPRSTTGRCLPTPAPSAFSSSPSSSPNNRASWRTTGATASPAGRA